VNETPRVFRTKGINLKYPFIATAFSTVTFGSEEEKIL
jgi:hypothetical protein